MSDLQLILHLEEVTIKYFACSYITPVLVAKTEHSFSKHHFFSTFDVVRHNNSGKLFILEKEILEVIFFSLAPYLFTDYD